VVAVDHGCGLAGVEGFDDGDLGEPGLAVFGVADDAVDLAGVEEGGAVGAADVGGFGLAWCFAAGRGPR
jgi:hypothetical protein